ncbi:four helix bundle protein [Prevotellaceae bacterium MN60]|nr:four helix bundle protein [Prevotellaceae bacterium HUN156]SNU04759.1 four helix bundle protein [Prevotellaceae bacterium MN60]
MKADNQVLIDSKAFALRIIRLYKYLKEDKQVYVLSKQVLRSGTSIGANIRESVNAQSRMDFVNKLNIALKEANETEYWLELLHESDVIDDKQFESIYNDCGKIAATLTKIIKTTKTEAKD